MKVACISDLHGFLPEIPDCDLLLIGGDIVPTTMHEPRFSALWMESALKPWLEKLSKRMQVVACAGNHDYIFQKRKDLIPALPWIYLEDSGAEFRGFKIYGSPWQNWFYDWAFNLHEPQLKEKWAMIPEDTEILLLHSPAHGYGDLTPYGNAHVGSFSLTKRLRELPNLKLMVCGHIHSGVGIYRFEDRFPIINASYLDEEYRPWGREVQVVEV